jgi:hypothetical protein
LPIYPQEFGDVKLFLPCPPFSLFVLRASGRSGTTPERSDGRSNEHCNSVKQRGNFCERNMELCIIPYNYLVSSTAPACRAIIRRAPSFRGAVEGPASIAAQRIVILSRRRRIHLGALKKQNTEDREAPI